MPVDTNNHIIPSRNGERGAMGGYRAQYDEFSRRVYDCILDGTLECIRVADAEENVGKLDDICYVTNTEVHAYQVKWTNNDDTFTYLDFKTLIKQVAEGWRKIKELYPHKTTIPHLLTNRKCSTEDRSVKGTNGKKLGTFADYTENVIVPLCSSQELSGEWSAMLDELNEVTGLKAEESPEFWSLFQFTPAFVEEKINVAEKHTNQRVSDLLDINRLIQEMAASKELLVTATIDEIVQKLGWSNRIHTQYDHNLKVLPAEYEPNKVAIASLNDLLESHKKGYLFLEGTPGSGKSTLITQWVKQIPNKCIRYYAFDFTQPSAQFINDSDRGDRMTFLFDLIKMLERAGFQSKDDTLAYKDYQFLKDRFIKLLDIIHQYFIETGMSTVIIVDGLDHVKREYTECLHTLFEALPSVKEIPKGVVFLLVSQFFKDLDLNRTILEEYRKGNTSIIMPPMSKEEVKSLTVKFLGEDVADAETVEACMSKSQGHPLYLRYVLNQISNTEAAIALNDIPPYDGNIEAYYSCIVPCLRTNAGMRNFLGLLSRIIDDIDYDFIQEWNVDDQVLLDFNNTLLHLFTKKSGRTLTFFHNSFRQYLLEETGKDAFDDSYSDVQNKKYYRKLADYTANSKVTNDWSVASYLYLAGEYEKFLKAASPDKLLLQMQDFRPLWHVSRDIEKMARVALSKKDVYLLLRTLFLKSQLAQMEMQDYSSLTLVEEFLKMGCDSLAKMQIREDRELKCSQNYALELARYFLRMGDKAEANILFELSYPEFLSHKPDEFHNRYNTLKEHHQLLEQWVHTATYLLPVESVEAEINKFVNYLHTFADHDREEYDAEYSTYLLKRKIVDSLVEQSKWIELDKYLNTELGVFSLPLHYYAYREKTTLLLSSKANDFVINDAFDALTKSFAELDDKHKPYLQMATLCQRANMTNEVIDSYLSNVTWESLGSYYMNDFKDNFSHFKQHIQYITLRSYLGYDDDLLSLVPDDNSHKDNELMISYARKVFTLAKLGGKAQHGEKKEIEFLGVIIPYMQSFDNCRFSDHNRYSYRISEQRSDFYEYLVKTASYFGLDILQKAADLASEYFSKDSCKANAKDKRKCACALYEYGIDKGYISTLLSDIEDEMYEYQDLDGRQRETYNQGKAWLTLGEREKAQFLFHRLIIESFGVGYRKDYQPTTFAEWINDANDADPANAIERIHWLSSRLHYINDCSESRTGTQAAEELLEGLFNLNLGAGLKLGKWMLDKEYGYFESVSVILIKHLLGNVTTQKEYKALLGLYTQIHLSYTNGFDPDGALLEAVFEKGQQILEGRFDKFSEELRLAIRTYCHKSYSEHLIERLEQLIIPKTAQKAKVSNRDYYRDSDKLLNEAGELLESGEKDKAWNKALEALASSSPAGWAKYYDGGTRFNACQMLVQIDKAKGREVAISQFAEDLTKGLGYSEMHYSTEIAHLLSDDVDVLRLFREQFDYMNRILREDSVHPEDFPDIEFSSMTTIEAVTSWLTYIAMMPIIGLSESAKILLAQMIADECSEVITVMQDEGANILCLLEVGMYVRELSTEALAGFKQLAVDNAISVNYQHRVFSKKILESLGEPIPTAPSKLFPALYSMYLPEVPSIRLEQNTSPYDVYVDWNNPCSIMSVTSHIMSYLRYCSHINDINLATRAVQFMQKYGTKADWDENADKTVGNHCRSICLYYPYRRPRSRAAINGMLEVASELFDSGAISGRYDDNVFMMNDFSVIRFKDNPRPEFVQRLAEKESWSMPKMWEYNASKSECLVDKLIEVQDMFVIAQSMQCRQHSDDVPFEEYNMKVSFNAEEQSDNDFFGTSPFMTLSSQYHQIGTNDPEIILLRNGYYVGLHSKQNWIAFNPALAYHLGWIPVDDGCFAWNDLNGNRMVESFYWKSGNGDYRHRSNHETGDGWYVVASQSAINSLKTIGDVFVHQHVHRGLESTSFKPYSFASKNFKLETM